MPVPCLLNRVLAGLHPLSPPGPGANGAAPGDAPHPALRGPADGGPPRVDRPRSAARGGRRLARRAADRLVALLRVLVDHALELVVGALEVMGDDVLDP